MIDSKELKGVNPLDWIKQKRKYTVQDLKRMGTAFLKKHKNGRKRVYAYDPIIMQNISSVDIVRKIEGNRSINEKFEIWIKGLSDKDKCIITLIQKNVYTQEEIARKIGVCRMTIYNRRKRLRKSLERFFNSYEC